MDMEDHKWIQHAMKFIKKGAFTKQALRHHETPMEYAKEVLENPESHTKTTRKRAQFLENISHSEAKASEMPEHSARKARKENPWNALVKMMALNHKGSKDALKLARTEASEAVKEHGSSAKALEARMKSKSKPMSKKKHQEMNY